MEREEIFIGSNVAFGGDPIPAWKRAVVIFVVLLPLLVLYAGSYVVLVVPEGIVLKGEEARITHYRFGGMAAAAIFWPIEQVDRKVRRMDWDDSL